MYIFPIVPFDRTRERENYIVACPAKIFVDHFWSNQGETYVRVTLVTGGYLHHFE